ncbi:efflux RND transporter periplasmic adaptor subunit [Acinetobacter piscicola]|uniref:efflux RND transporter periplasmic adaptor subunit n=1 Tax=Acinetobacter piscicola TaxID=2006115 RepID=UPI00101F1B17|nr:efflux RND transporter periplasmic adaptor subunit [Acinetobacter piscicola]RYL27824.1 efflux RND transporter periplasmic adaptor subunit [Acinetobacter piscicola]
MIKQKLDLNTQSGKVSQSILILIAVISTAILAAALIWWTKDQAKTDEHGHGAEESHAEEKEHQDGAEGHAHDESEDTEQGHAESIALTAQQLVEQGIQLAKVEQGSVMKLATYPAKLTVNTDQQAHVSPNFSGHVEAVYVQLGQSVQKGQVLATLLVPDLVDQQANLKLEQANLQLAKQDYERERQLWQQGISAKQDYQRAYNAYQQAQIQVQAAQSRLSAFGAASSSRGQYQLKAPISGVISKKDLVVGENVQLADQLFVIDQLNQLWLEFIVPHADVQHFSPNRKINFKSLQSGNHFQAEVQSLNTEADAQTGRLQVRAKVLSQSAELKPNLMVNILLEQGTTQGIRIQKSAIQKIDGQSIVFIAKNHDQKIEFSTQPVQLNTEIDDPEWVSVISGVNVGQQYAAQGSFLLKSELEKGEATHEH